MFDKWGGVLTSCKHSSSSGGEPSDPEVNEPNDKEPEVLELDLTMYKDSKNENEIDSLPYVVGDEEQKSPYFYVQSLNYPEKNQIELEEAYYTFDGDDEELDPDEDIAVSYKKANRNYKITLHKVPQQPGSYDFTLSFSADNGQENELEFTVKVSKKTAGGGEITGAAPKITTDLEDGVGTESVTLKVVATVADGANITYQWYQDGEKIDGATNSSYEAKKTGAYYVKVSANDQTVQSNTANVVIDSSIDPTEPTPTVTIPKITINSANGLEIKDRILKVPEASDGILSISVDVTAESYQWYIIEETSGNDELLSGATNPTYTPLKFAGYYCKIMVEGRTYQSSTVKVIEEDIVITALNPNFGEETYLNSELKVDPKTNVPCTYAYQWYKVEDETSGNSDPISGATNATYTPTKAGWYECKVTPTSIAMGTKGTARTTDKVRVREKTANDPDRPTISAITKDTSLKEGEKLTLSVTASANNGVLSYQWLKGNNPISGATKSTYEKSNITTDDAGTYTCKVINVFNGNSVDAVSDPVTVTVTKTGSSTGSVGGSFDFN